MNNTSSVDPWLAWVKQQREAFKRYQAAPLSVVLVVGFVANVTVLCSGVKKYIRAKYNTNSFILNLAVADLGVILFYIPIQMIEYTIGLDVSDWTCKYIIPLRETFLTVSLITVAELGMVRFLQFHSHHMLSKRVTYSVIVLTWILSYLATSFPISFVIMHTHAMTCDHFWEDEEKATLHISFIDAIQFVPLLITTVCYSSIIKKARQLEQEHRDVEGNDWAQRTHSAIFLMLMLIVTAWWSFGPFLVYSILSLLDVPFEYPLVAWSAISFFMTSGSAINPVIILLMNKDYRRGLTDVFCQKEIPVELDDTRITAASAVHRDANLKLEGINLSSEKL